MAILVIGVIVIFHEFGHFLLARLNGIGVAEFSVGFGPRLLTWKSQKSGTRYSLKCIPLGGSCAMIGSPEEEGVHTPEELAAYEAMIEGVQGDSFLAKSPLRRMSVVAAGPIFNFIMAFACALVIIFWAGYDAPEILEVNAGQAADLAGLQAGDVVTKIGNRRVYLARDMILYMMVHGNEDTVMEYKRLNEATGQWERGRAFLDADHYLYQNGRYMTGLSFSGYRTSVESIPELLRYGVAEVRYVVCSVVDSLSMVVRGKVQRDDIAGPIRIVTIIDDTVEQATPYGAVTVLMNVLNLIIMFSANLGVMNLLPVPALDGGRLVFLAWEFLTRKPANIRVENAVNLTGMALLLAFMLFVVFNDLRILL